MTTLPILFPGQGAQARGMGRDFAAALPEAAPPQQDEGADASGHGVLGTRLRAEKQFDLEERVLLEEVILDEPHDEAAREAGPWPRASYRTTRAVSAKGSPSGHRQKSHRRSTSSPPTGRRTAPESTVVDTSRLPMK